MIYYILPTNDDLTHHGVDGQKWGVKNGPPYPLDRAGKRALKKQIRKEKKKSKQMNKYAKRLGKRNENINYFKMEKNKSVKEAEERISQHKEWDSERIRKERFLANYDGNYPIEGYQFDNEVAFDKLYEQIEKKFDQKSIDSILDLYKNKYYGKSDEYFNKSKEYREIYEKLFNENNKRLK